MTDTPFFSVVIPTYNRASLLVKSVNSVLAQTCADFELIIVDDGSTDNTREVVMSFSDSRIHYYYKENEERNLARNFGIEKARGKYVCFLDSDDYYLNSHLEIAYALIKSDSAKFLHLGYRIEDINGRILKTVDDLPAEISKKLLKSNVLSANGIVVLRTLINSVQFIKSKNYLVGEDHLLWLQLYARSNLLITNDITSVMIEHATRSLHSMDPLKYAVGLHDMMNHLKRDKLFFQFYKRKAFFFIADNFRFGALLFALSKMRVDSLKLLFKSVQISRQILFQKAFYAVIKNLV
jgi:glycosyltransferase involved in cell wall biosynthesis